MSASRAPRILVVDEIVCNIGATRRLPDPSVVGSGVLSKVVDNGGAAAPQAVDRVRDAIVSGKLQPNERLVESDLATSLGVSRTVVRAALTRLEHEGLVEHERHRGSRVRLVDESEAVEILEARSVLEGLAARLAAQRATSADVEGLEAILSEMHQLRAAGDLLRVSDENAKLHGRLVQISGHRTARRLIGTLNSQMVRFQYRTILLPGRGEHSASEHAAIVKAVAAGDENAAEDAMRAHLSHVAEALRRSRPA